MRNQRVEIVMYDRESVPYVKDEWEFAAKHKWAWFRKLQIAAFQWLVKHGALKNAIGVELKYTRVVLSDQQPTIRSIHEVLMNMAQNNARPKHLYVGADMAEAIMGIKRDATAMHVMSFTSGTAREIMGIPWTVVPWMKGWVIVPEERR